MSDTNFYDIVGFLDSNSPNLDEDFTNVLPVLELEIPDILIGEDDEEEEEDTIDFNNNDEIWADVGLDPAVIDGLLPPGTTGAPTGGPSTSSLTTPVNIMMNGDVLPRNVYPSNHSS